jgi:hypothetical protein
MSRWIPVLVLGFACLLILPARASAQYLCPVSIDVKDKKVLQAQIRDVERPPTEELWQILQTLAFTGEVPEPNAEGRAVLKGDIRVKIDGAGEVKLLELRLVPNKRGKNSWVIAPEDFERIGKLRKEASKEKRKK